MFDSAVRSILVRDFASTKDEDIAGYAAWLCGEMRQVRYSGFHGLTVVHTIAIAGIERRDMVFGVAGRGVWLLNPWAVGQDNALIDIRAWNAFIRARLDLSIGLDNSDEIGALLCVLNQVAFGNPAPGSCYFIGPINVSQNGSGFTISSRDDSYYHHNPFKVGEDGALLEPPTYRQ